LAENLAVNLEQICQSKTLTALEHGETTRHFPRLNQTTGTTTKTQLCL
jgi:hypothetical protein